MQNLGKRTRGWIFGLLLLAVASDDGRTQWSTKGTQIPQSPTQPISPGRDPNESASVELQHKQEKLRQDERQKRLVADTEKLLTLATQLHEDVGKTDKNVLSMDVIHRADEIERLAHAVKERMKG